MTDTSREDFLLKYMAHISYTHVGKQSIVCCITAYNGYEVVGAITNIDSTPYKASNELSAQKAYEAALAKFDTYIMFLQYDRHYLVDFEDLEARAAKQMAKAKSRTRRKPSKSKQTDTNE